jgi:hypothetical protein
MFIAALLLILAESASQSNAGVNSPCVNKTL